MGHPFSVAATETLTGHRTLTVAEVNASAFMSFDPGGAGRNLILPAEASCAGIMLFISNQADAAEVITIQDDTPATVCTPTQNEDAIVWCDGVKWHGGTLASS
jgi:hypothetical protein